jgi:hypothetical protein
LVLPGGKEKWLAAMRSADSDGNPIIKPTKSRTTVGSCAVMFEGTSPPNIKAHHPALFSDSEVLKGRSLPTASHLLFPHP